MSNSYSDDSTPIKLQIVLTSAGETTIRETIISPRAEIEHIGAPLKGPYFIPSCLNWLQHVESAISKADGKPGSEWHLKRIRSAITNIKDALSKENTDLQAIETKCHYIYGIVGELNEVLSKPFVQNKLKANYDAQNAAKLSGPARNAIAEAEEGIKTLTVSMGKELKSAGTDIKRLTTKVQKQLEVLGKQTSWKTIKKYLCQSGVIPDKK